MPVDGPGFCLEVTTDLIEWLSTDFDELIGEVAQSLADRAGRDDDGTWP